MAGSFKINSALYALATTFLLGAQAQQDAMPGQTFVDDPLSAVRASAPAWFLDQATCFPDKAIINGQPNAGLDPGSNCLTSLGGCPKQPAMNGERTQAAGFPTYYTMQYCDDDPDDISWRISYDVYFPKDSGHRHDWEFAIVKWKKQTDGSFLRDAVWMEQDPDIQHYIWDNIDTYTTDVAEAGKNLNHPKLYFAKWHHSVHPDLYKVNANDCGAGSADYRSNDYVWEAKDMLVDASTIKQWPSDLSIPSKFTKGGKNDMCRYAGN